MNGLWNACVAENAVLGMPTFEGEGFRFGSFRKQEGLRLPVLD